MKVNLISKRLREYINKYVNSGPENYMNPWDDTLDFDQALIFAKMGGGHLDNPKVQEALKEAIRNSAPFKIEMFYEEKQKFFDSLNVFDKIIFSFIEFKKVQIDKLDKWFDHIRDRYPDLERVFPKPLYKKIGKEDWEMLKWLDKQGLVDEAIENMKPVKTNTIKAHIEKHAEGKIVDALFGKKFGKKLVLNKDCQIVSYNVIPNKDTSDIENMEELVRDCGNAAEFTHEGCLPEEDEGLEFIAKNNLVKF